jgi:hypothetical protein
VTTKRRDALKNGLALLGVAAGMETAGKAAVAPKEKEGVQMILHGRQWRIFSQDLRRGQFPSAGIRMLASGEIVNEPSGGQKIGDFFATYYRLSTPGKAAADEPGSLEVHTFVLPEGTIVGTGVAPAGFDGEGHFAITGGTGRYHGARGSYVARQSHADLGGDGTATFTLKLI